MNLDKYQKQHDLEEKEALLKLVEEVKEAGVDIRSIKNSILKDFKLKTEKDTRPFGKVAKSKNKKSRPKFIEKYVLPTWISQVEPTNEWAPLMREHIPHQEFIPFLMAIFISIHSINLEKNIDSFIEGILAALIQKTSQIMNEQGLLKEVENV